jgi:hypothetical protein
MTSPLPEPEPSATEASALDAGSEGSLQAAAKRQRARRVKRRRKAFTP